MIVRYLLFSLMAFARARIEVSFGGLEMVNKTFVRKVLGLAMACIALTAFFVQEANAQLAVGGLTRTGAGVAQALSTSAAKFTAFTAALPSTTTDGDQSIVASVANDNVAVVAGGVYVIRFSYSGTADATAAITYSIRDGATAITGAEATINHPASTSVSGSIDTVYRPTAAGTLNVYAVAGTGTPNITATTSNFVVMRIK